MRRNVFILMATLFGIIAVIGIGLYVYLRSFIPNYNAALKAPGLKDTVVIERNKYAVPTIRAQNDDDLYFAWGYVNAQDRFFQMETTRRISQGRISEFAGESELTKDMFLRSVGFYEIAKRSAKALDPTIAGYLQRYVDGINYYLDTHGTPPYMQILGMQKEKWQIEDAGAVSMMLTWSLAYNMKNELLYYKMADKVGHDGVMQLVQYCAPDSPTTVDDIVSLVPSNVEAILRGGESIPPAVASINAKRERSLSAEKKLASLFDDFGWLLGTRSTSNAWVVSPQKTAHKGTILVSDMQLHFSKLPNDLYYIRVNAGDYYAVGAQVPGLPVIVSGYNRHIAWANTNNNIDIVDLFTETIDWDKKTYRHAGNEYPLTSREELFRVKGRKEPIRKTLYYAGRRPILSEVFSDLGVDISLDWMGFEELTYEGFFHLNRAHNHDEFLDGANAIRMSPTNMVYADREGNIAYRVIGSLPARKEGTGNLPANGEEVDCNWTGNIPDDEYPAVKNPPRGFIVTSNNKVVKDFPYDLNPTYYAKYRYENVATMLRDAYDIDLDYARKVHVDTHTVMANEVVPLVKRYVAIDENDADMKGAYDILLEWDGNVSKDSVAASIYNTFFVRFAYQTVVDEIGHEAASEYIGDQRLSVGRFFKLLKDDSDFFDDVRTPGKESIRDIATRAFKETLVILAKYSGSPRVEDWKWGTFHKITFDHLLGKSALLRPFVNYGPFPFEGDRQTNNRASFSEVEPPFITEQASAPRIIVVFDPEPKGYMMLATGENEYFLSEHYTDMTDAWLRHEYFCMEEEPARYKTTMKPE
ncbi:MAG: penicillin acylase family protein [Candidatus Abyssobacteria bacterium SURF_17]|uniref:Penicillin acylase family protein n=1 Tax=Candidatus Abyssobacteria bacterium SURF_17 TaxID=2093361 RepID=A0A419EXE6_9BACT|nr:MAG: penicillin acylase family protein [Candidatus Abyssubacteria bacterium SURF_17]